MNETTILKQVLLEVCKIPGVRAWRQNTGSAYPPAEVDKILMGIPGRLVAYSVPGAADITGLANGIRLEIETKTATGRQREAQKSFQQMIESQGGMYILARSAKQAVEELTRRMR